MEAPGGSTMGLAAGNNLPMTRGRENPAGRHPSTEKCSLPTWPDCETEHLDRPSQVYSFVLTTYDTDPELLAVRQCLGRTETGAGGRLHALARSPRSKSAHGIFWLMAPSRTPQKKCAGAICANSKQTKHDRVASPP